MAGIAGVINKKGSRLDSQYEKIFQTVLTSISYNDLQLREHYQSNNLIFGNVVPVAQKNNNRFQYIHELGIACVVDGLVFVSEEESRLVKKRYSLEDVSDDYALLPYFYDAYKDEIVYHLTGWFNIFFYDEILNKSLLVNDRLGYLPLYIYEDENWFAFSSKIDGILASKLIKQVEFDYTTLTEHLLFNYPLSDKAYILGIDVLSNALRVQIEPDQIVKEKYWSFNEFYDIPALNKKDSFKLFNESLLRSVEKGLTQDGSIINFSLTGGWDSRVVLAYLLPEHKEKINLYSFGAENSSDIIVPLHIAKKEHLTYTPFVLDQEYLENSFLQAAKETILLSGGTRNYKRTHYIYSIKEMSGKSANFFSGIFGDEVMKVGRPKGGEVLSRNIIKFIESECDDKLIINTLKSSPVFDYISYDKNRIMPELKERLSLIKKTFSGYDTKSKQYLAFRFELNLRKYFGFEVNGYNDFAYSYSPFIDYDFLKNYAKTIYFGARYDYYSQSSIQKRQSTKLYSGLVLRNYRSLARYNSSRRYSMSDANTLHGNVKILFRRYFNNKKIIDGFNTDATDKIFLEKLSLAHPLDLPIKVCNKRKDEEKAVENINTLCYWTDYILKRYM